MALSAPPSSPSCFSEASQWSMPNPDAGCAVAAASNGVGVGGRGVGVAEVSPLWAVGRAIVICNVTSILVFIVQILLQEISFLGTFSVFSSSFYSILCVTRPQLCRSTLIWQKKPLGKFLRRHRSQVLRGRVVEEVAGADENEGVQAARLKFRFQSCHLALEFLRPVFLHSNI